MVKSVLCSIDFSESSRLRMVHAIEIARRLNDSLIILYTYRLTQAKTGEAIILKRKMEELAVQAFSEWEHKYFKNSDVDYNFTSEVGFETDRIEEHLRSKNVSVLLVDKFTSQEKHETLEELIRHRGISLITFP